MNREEIVIELIKHHEKELADLRRELADIQSPKIVCDICGSNENVRHAGPWLMGKDMRVCSVCFTVWYDESVTSTDEIRQRSLLIRSQAAKHQGQKSV